MRKKIVEPKIIKPFTVLGFDVSSTTIGYAVLKYEDETITLVENGFVKPVKDKSIIISLAETRDEIKKIIEKNKPDIIAIEDIIKFMKGKSSAQTIVTLTAFNRMIGLLSYDALNKEPSLYNVLTIRHAIKRRAGLKKLPQKEELPDILNKIGINFEWRLNKKGKKIVENYDISDAICCAYCHILSIVK